MISFLEYVAEDIVSKFQSTGEATIDLTDVVVVFPNKRASLFLNQYLYKAAGNRPVWCPRYITISELFRHQSALTTADPIMANCILYEVYSRIMEEEYEKQNARNPEYDYQVESLDRFWSWGQMMLADFDDLDKNMGNVNLVFSNVRDLEALQATPSEYLTENQKATLMEFFHLVSDKDGESVLKRNFELLWNNLHRIYLEFNEALREKGLAYEGALYREVAERSTTLTWEHRKYLFVGFNMIQKSEQALFESMKKQDLALFYWDYDEYYADKEAGHFISQEMMLRFPNELAGRKEVFRNFCRKDGQGEKMMKDVTYLSASTENIQARYITDWLNEEGKNRLADNQRTAIVLCDESLLKNVIHNLPKETSGKANITVGFPLSQSPVTSLVMNFLQLHREEFVMRSVSNVLRHPYADFLSAHSAELLEELHEKRIFYPKKEFLCSKDEHLALLFDPCQGDGVTNGGLLAALLKILKIIGSECERRKVVRIIEAGGDPERGAATYEEQFMEESVFKMHGIISRLHELISTHNYLDVDLVTLIRIISQIIQTTSMPFHGEPAVSLQIMGVLETRNLDFDHVLMLSCNEGNLPKDVSTSSLIPYLVRKAHGLTTVDHKVAIFAYYFYRLLQRCNDVSIAYNSSTEDGHTGQMSRFMLQLMVEDGYMALTRKNLIARQSPDGYCSHEIEKDADVQKALGEIKSLSPSAINKYLRCPLQFYYDKLANLREPDDEENIDPRNFGTIFHAAAEEMYNNIMDNDRIVNADAIKALLGKNGEASILRFIDKAFQDNYFGGNTPHYDGMQTINREVIKRYITNLLKADLELAPFQIVGLECKAYDNIEVRLNDGTTRHLSIGGTIDRLDCVSVKDGNGVKRVMRVVDYKTGSKRPELQSDVASLFLPANVDKHADYLLQVMLYGIIVRHSHQLNTSGLAVSPALLYIQKAESRKDPVIQFGNKSNAVPVSDVLPYEEDFRLGLNKLMAEIFDPAIPFRPTDIAKHCEYCCYRKLCKR